MPRSEYIVCPLPFYANDGSDVRFMPEEHGHQQARVEQQHLDSFPARPFMHPISPNDTFLVWFMNADNPRRILNYLKDYHHLLQDDYANAYYLISLFQNFDPSDTRLRVRHTPQLRAFQTAYPLAFEPVHLHYDNRKIGSD